MISYEAQSKQKGVVAVAHMCVYDTLLELAPYPLNVMLLLAAEEVPPDPYPLNMLLLLADEEVPPLSSLRLPGDVEGSDTSSSPTSPSFLEASECDRSVCSSGKWVPGSTSFPSTSVRRPMMQRVPQSSQSVS